MKEKETMNILYMKNNIQQFMADKKHHFSDLTKLVVLNCNYFEEANYDFFDLYLQALIELYRSDDSIFYQESKTIFTSEDDVIATTIMFALRDLDTHPSGVERFFVDYLNSFSENGRTGFYLMKGKPDKGFYFDSLIYIPDEIENPTLIVEGCNTCNNTSRGELHHPSYITNSLPYATSLQYLIDFKAPIFIPLIPNQDSTISSETVGYHERYARQLSRNTVNPDLASNPAVHDQSDFLYRMDLQVLNAKECAKELICEKKNVELEEKGLLYGFSTSGNLAVRLAFLHPFQFCGVIAGGINAAIPVPIPTYHGVDLIYPVGTYDYEKMTGREFDYDAYSQLNQYYFMGSDEEQDQYNTVAMPSLHDPEVTNTYQALSLDLYERADNINSLYQSLGFPSDRIEIYKGGHSPSLAEDKIKNLASQWISENQSHYSKK